MFFFVLKGDMKPRETPNQKNMLSLGQASWCCRCKGEDQNQVGLPSTNQGFEWLNPNIFTGGNVGEYWFRSSWLLIYAKLCWNSIFETSADPFIYFKISILRGQFVWYSSLEENPQMWDGRVFPQILLNQKLCIVSLMALMSFVCQTKCVHELETWCLKSATEQHAEKKNKLTVHCQDLIPLIHICPFSCGFFIPKNTPKKKHGACRFGEPRNLEDWRCRSVWGGGG